MCARMRGCVPARAGGPRRGAARGSCKNQSNQLNSKMAVLLALLALAGLVLPSVAANQAPNIAFILVDDYGHTDVGCE